MPTQPLQFWFEFASTYSYVAAMQIEEQAAAAGVEVQWKPFLLGPLFASVGWTDSPFNIYPVKGAYMWRDMERLCEEANIPLRRPTVFPRNGLLAARVACIAETQQWAGPFVREVYGANFASDEDISSEDVIAAVISKLGHDPDSVIQAARTTANKEFLKQQTAEAAVLGIFGAPTFVCGSELFWGSDRLPHALRWVTRK
jgi:2-hydroxychromene-2-carboxylate isomerase